MKYVLALITGVIGLVLGALVVLFLLGAPKAKTLPGAPVQAQEPAGGDAPGTAVITLDEKFFDALLGSVFRDLGQPSFPLELTMMEKRFTDSSSFNVIPAALQNDCPDQIVIKSEGSSVRTGVRFTNGKIMAPLAFTGSKNLFGCQRFQGWAQANIELRFDEAKQTVYGWINVEGVNLENTPDVVGSVATLLVQRSINQRINPMEILRAPQLALAMPIQSTNGTLNARVKGVRSEVLDGKLVLHLSFDFAGVRGGAQPQG